VRIVTLLGLSRFVLSAVRKRGGEVSPCFCGTIPGSALGSLLSVALSSDQAMSIIPYLFWPATENVDWPDANDPECRQPRRGTTQAPRRQITSASVIAAKRNVTLRFKQAIVELINIHIERSRI